MLALAYFVGYLLCVHQIIKLFNVLINLFSMLSLKECGYIMDTWDFKHMLKELNIAFRVVYFVKVNFNIVDN